MNFVKPFASGLMCLLLGLGAAFAQGVGSSGDIKGSITDPSGAVVPKATVTVTDLEKGTKRTAVTDSDGQFHVTGLAPATYSVSVAPAGFQKEIQNGVIVNIGQTAVLDFHVKLSAATEQVEVNLEPAVVETERGAQSNVVSQQYIAELPIDRRDYLTYTLLVPGVSDSTRLAGDQDFRVKQTPQSGLSFYGSNGRGNSVTVDGAEANDDAGGVRLNLSQDAVQEFQINRSNYSAELGGANGATINIVSKSGTNQVHGSAYSFFRNDALDARNPFSFSQALQPGQVFNPLSPDSLGSPVKDSLSRQQFGGTIGFPIKKDKTFVFAAFEGLLQDAQNAVPLLTNTSIFRPQSDPRNNQVALLNALAARGGAPVPCFSNGANPPTVLPAAVCAGALTSALTTSPTTGLTAGATARNSFLNNQFENNGGLFPFNTRRYQLSGRLDHQFSEHNQVYLRYSFSHDREESPDLQSLTGFSRGSSIRSYDDTLQGSWFHQFSPSVSNEARLQWSYSTLNVVPNQPGEVGLDIPGFASLGTQIFLPNLTIMRRYEFADNISMIRGHHNMKFGGYELIRGNHSESHTFFPGRFVFGTLPGGLVSPCFVASPNAATPNFCGLQTTGASINPLQSASLGLPQFYQQGFDNPGYAANRPLFSGFWQDSWTIRPNFTFNYGVRYELDSQYGNLNTDKDNFAPRVSFAWDPFGDHKTVVRGGYGIFYSPTYAQIANVVQTLGVVNGFRQIAQVFVPLTGVPGSPPSLTSAAIFQTLFAQGKVQCTTPTAGNAACITPADLTQFGINITHTGAIPPLTVVFAGQPDYQNPYSQQGEFGIEREIAGGLSVSLSYTYVHTLKLPVAIDTNALSTTPFTTVTLANGQSVSYQNWNSNPATGPAPCAGAAIVNCFANPLRLQNNVYSSAGSALYNGGILEVKKRFGSHINIFGNYTYSQAIDTTTDFNSDFGPFNQTNLGAERGLSNFDQRHKIVIAGVLESPWKGGRDANVGERIVSGFTLAPIFRYNSSHPFNLLAGADVNGDRHSTNDRPVGAGRNTGIGPDYIDFDMRIARAIKLGERASVQLVAEGFNLFNRTNFASVNNVVGPRFGFTPGFTTYSVSGTNGVGPSSPLGFTSAQPKREFQFGLRIGF